MPPRDVPRTGLYLFSGACGLFATGYGALDLMPAPGMAFLLGWGPAIAVAWWLSEDSKRTRTLEAFDSGLFFYLTWPLTLPWGATLRFFVVS